MLSSFVLAQTKLVVVEDYSGLETDGKVRVDKEDQKGDGYYRQMMRQGKGIETSKEKVTSRIGAEEEGNEGDVKDWSNGYILDQFD